MNEMVTNLANSTVMPFGPGAKMFYGFLVRSLFIIEVVLAGTYVCWREEFVNVHQ
jgi:hypothetical protein